MIEDGFRDDMTLGEARDELRLRVEAGAVCPCCKRFAKVYKRQITASMAYMLIRMWRHGAADEFVNLPDLRDGHGSMDTTMTKYWDLIVEMAERREDGGRAGWWRLTGLGERYVLGEATVPQYVRVFDDRRLSYLGPALSIHVALGKKFDYAELMSL